jgi:predicted nucleic acid-binding protein
VARPEVLDTTVFSQFFRSSYGETDLFRAIAGGQLWLSSVVIAELYAGTRSPEDARLLDRVVTVMRRIERILTPTDEDWIKAGRLIGRRIRLAGALRPRDQLADVIILVSAAYRGGKVLTANVRHYEAWADLARSTGMDVMVEAAS